jgi:hypothetical protein
VVPQRVAPFDREAIGQRLLIRLRARFVLRLGCVRVAVGQVLERVVPGRQVDEARLRTDLARDEQRLPLRRVLGERRPRAALHAAAREIAVDRERQRVAEEQLVDARVEIRRPFDQHMPRPQRADARRDQARAGRTVVAHANDAGRALAHGRRCRASKYARQCAPVFFATFCSK